MSQEAVGLMVRLLYSMGVLALVCAGGVLMLCAGQWSRSNRVAAEVFARPGAVQAFVENGGRDGGARGESISPLVAQARALAALLDPPKPPAIEAPVVQATPKPPGPAAAPVAVSPRFKIRGTSYCVDEPESSIALIWEPGSPDSGRWVREGDQLGHYVIHEIREGSIVCMVGDELCEFAVEEPPEAPAAVASGRPSEPSPRAAASNRAPAKPIAQQPKRPTGDRGPTVGSTRTAALN